MDRDGEGAQAAQPSAQVSGGFTLHWPPGLTFEEADRRGLVTASGTGHSLQGRIVASSDPSLIGREGALTIGEPSAKLPSWQQRDAAVRDDVRRLMVAELSKRVDNAVSRKRNSLSPLTRTRCAAEVDALESFGLWLGVDFPLLDFDVDLDTPLLVETRVHFDAPDKQEETVEEALLEDPEVATAIERVRRAVDSETLDDAAVELIQAIRDAEASDHRSVDHAFELDFDLRTGTRRKLLHDTIVRTSKDPISPTTAVELVDAIEEALEDARWRRLSPEFERVAEDAGDGWSDPLEVRVGPGGSLVHRHTEDEDELPDCEPDNEAAEPRTVWNCAVVTGTALPPLADVGTTNGLMQRALLRGWMEIFGSRPEFLVSSFGPLAGDEGESDSLREQIREILANPPLNPWSPEGQQALAERIEALVRGDR